MRSIRGTLAAVLLEVISTVAVSASFSTDQSDLWWASPAGSESGWGFQLVQRNSTIFATMYVYAQSNSPTWYVSTMAPTGSSEQWSGDLYTTTGPWFGTVPFNPSAVTARKVGTMTWTATDVNTGTLSYTVDGVAVMKNAVRETLVNENYNGHFGGGIHESDTSCANSGINGTVEGIGVVDISQNGTNVSVTATAGGSCSYSGTLTQYGQMGDIQGTFACTNGANGTFEIYELQVTEISVIGRFTTQYNSPAGCQGSGWFGGFTVTTF
jgi:hypothetical protein